MPNGSEPVLRFGGSTQRRHNTCRQRIDNAAFHSVFIFYGRLCLFGRSLGRTICRRTRQADVVQVHTPYLLVGCRCRHSVHHRIFCGSRTDIRIHNRRYSCNKRSLGIPLVVRGHTGCRNGRFCVGRRLHRTYGNSRDVIHHCNFVLDLFHPILLHACHSWQRPPVARIRGLPCHARHQPNAGLHLPFASAYRQMGISEKNECKTHNDFTKNNFSIIFSRKDLFYS